MNKIRVAILGTGNIGTDLAERLLRDSEFEVVAFVGRRGNSPGLEKLRGRVENLISNGISGLESIWGQIDAVFDATSAFDHRSHWETIERQGKFAVDLTPSKIGKPIVPELVAMNESMKLHEARVANYSMVTCGGQSSAPLIHAIASNADGLREIEISSSIASLSAGPATRRNLDQYISSTEGLAELLSGGVPAKAVLVLNPSEPPVMMRTTVTVAAQSFNLAKISADTVRIVKSVKNYVSGYDLVVEPHLFDGDKVSATVKVTGMGYYLPEYSGNLDIINAAAVETARRHYRKHFEVA